MPDLRVAVITDVFTGPDGGERLNDRLAEARRRGADLAALPELPLNPWSPVSTEARAEDAEPLDGPRSALLRAAARDHGVAVLGGIIERDPTTGRRFNCARLFSASGEELGRYRKTHLPEEEGYWETSHYEPGDELATVISGLALPVGIQICSDNNRPAGTQILAAAGAGAILAPRATPTETYPRWRLVLRANALTCCVYVVSTNRPGPVPGVDMGGPSLVIGPDGEVILETIEPVALATLSSEALERERREYPGYLPVRAALYATGWKGLDRE